MNSRPDEYTSDGHGYTIRHVDVRVRVLALARAEAHAALNSSDGGLEPPYVASRFVLPKGGSGGLRVEPHAAGLHRCCVRHTVAPEGPSGWLGQGGVRVAVDELRRGLGGVEAVQRGLGRVRPNLVEDVVEVEVQAHTMRVGRQRRAGGSC